MRIGAPGADLAGGGAGFALFWAAGAGAGAGAAPGAGALGLNNPENGALLLDSTRVTPVVKSTTMRSPVSTLVPWVTTTLPVNVMLLVLMSNTPISPFAVWSFCVTSTSPLASTRLICWLPPPKPGAAAFGAAAAAAGAPFADGAGAAAASS